MAPVGGTMCAASPARNRRPYCIGSTTKLRMPVTPFSSIGPSSSVQPSPVSSRVCSSVPDARRRASCARSSSGAHLQVQPRDLGRAHAVEREAALVVRVDQLVVRRRRLGEDAEPRERVRRARRSVSAPCGIDCAADAVEAVAAGDEVAGERRAPRRRACSGSTASRDVEVVRRRRRSPRTGSCRRRRAARGSGPSRLPAGRRP